MHGENCLIFVVEVEETIGVKSDLELQLVLTSNLTSHLDLVISIPVVHKNKHIIYNVLAR